MNPAIMDIDEDRCQDFLYITSAAVRGTDGDERKRGITST